MYNARQFNVASRPYFDLIFVEIANACNFSCWYCPMSTMSRKTGLMDVDLAKDILDQIAENHLAERVAFHVMGEPLLHPQFPEILTYARSAGLKCMVNTNGSRFSEDSLIDSVLENANIILISLRSTNEMEYQQSLRSYHNGDYNIYIANIQRLIERKLSTNSAARIYLRVFDSARHTHLPKALVRAYDFVRKLDVVLQQNPLPRHGVVGPIKSIELYKDVYVRFDPFMEFWFRARGKFYKGRWGKCDALQKQLAILYNGDCTTCCYDYNGTNTLGNVMDKPITEILAGERARYFEEQFGRMRLPTTLCQECFGASSIPLWLLRNLSVLGQYINIVPPKSFV